MLMDKKEMDEAFASDTHIKIKFDFCNNTYSFSKSELNI